MRIDEMTDDQLEEALTRAASNAHWLLSLVGARKAARTDQERTVITSDLYAALESAPVYGIELPEAEVLAESKTAADTVLGVELDVKEGRLDDVGGTAG